MSFPPDGKNASHDADQTPPEPRGFRTKLAATLTLALVGATLAAPFFLAGPTKTSTNFTSSRARTPASADQPPHKVEILQTKTRLAREMHVRAAINSARDNGLGVPLNTRLVAVVDNECAVNRLHMRKANRLGQSSLSLSEIALARAEKGPIEGLRVQAYAFNSLEDARVEDLEQAAQDDDCVLNLVDERERRVHSTVTASDPLAAAQLHLNFLNLPTAWTLFANSGRPITQDAIVAVVDTGVDPNHEDLVQNFWSGPNGAIGYDFVSNTPQLSDDIGHGTHVAGLLAAAMNNGKGGAGAMSSHIKIMAVKVIDANDSGTLSQLINGIHYAADHGANVINLSLGGTDGAQAEIDAINYANNAGAVVVIAAGNSGLEMSTSQNDYPAGYAADFAGAIAVGSVDSKTGAMSYFSNHSPNYVYIAAPGADDSSSNIGLLSTFPNNQYQRLEGTSMSAPLVSAAAAYIFAIAKSGGVTPAPKDVVSAVLNSARPDPNLTGSFRNGAVLDFARLAQEVQLRFMLDGDAGTGETP